MGKVDYYFTGIHTRKKKDHERKKAQSRKEYLHPMGTWLGSYHSATFSGKERVTSPMNKELALLFCRVVQLMDFGWMMPELKWN